MKQKRKKILWRISFTAIITFAALVLFGSLLFQKPRGFTNPKVSKQKHVSKYLTHELSPKFYEGIQRQQPFDLAVTQEGMNDIILHSKWPKESGEFSFLAPRVFFAKGSIILIGTVIFRDVDFVVTIVAGAAIDKKGLLNLKVRQVRIGAMNATILVKAIARRIYQHGVAKGKVDANEVTFKLVGALLADESIEPTLKIGGEMVRLKEVEVEDGKIGTVFEPIRQ